MTKSQYTYRIAMGRPEMEMWGGSKKHSEELLSEWHYAKKISHLLLSVVFLSLLISETLSLIVYTYILHLYWLYVLIMQMENIKMYYRNLWCCCECISFSVIYTSSISSSSFFTLSPNKSSALFSIAVITLNYRTQSHCLASCKPALNFYLIYFFKPAYVFVPCLHFSLAVCL